MRGTRAKMLRRQDVTIPNIIVAKNYKVANIPMLHKLVLQKIFDKDMNYIDEALLQHSLEKWCKKIDKTVWEIDELLKIVKALERNDKNGYARQKEFITRHNLDYKLIYTEIE